MTSQSISNGNLALVEAMWYSGENKYGLVPISAVNIDEHPTTRKSSSQRMNNISLCSFLGNPQHFPLPHKPLLLDLYCGAGGCSYGYSLAGFDIVGVDIAPQPHYPFTFHQGDALAVLDMLLAGYAWHGYFLNDFAVIHASPECKSYTNCNLSPKERYPQHILPARNLLRKTGKPYIIENVVGAKHHMQASLMLCGSMFGLPMQRHRLFEFGNMDIWIRPPKPCDHRSATIGVYGHSIWDESQIGTPRKDGKKRPDSVPLAVGRAAMGISWMGIEELAEAIPPAYTQWIGQQLLPITSLELEVRA